jgi:hypothetical protein
MSGSTYHSTHDKWKSKESEVGSITLLGTRHMKQRHLHASLYTVIATLILSGCVIPHTSSRAPIWMPAHTICPVHNMPLLTLALPTHDNCTLPDLPYEEARDRLFPYAPDLLFETDNISEPMKLLICTQCWSAQQKWLRWGEPSPQQKTRETTSDPAPSAESEASQP